jgi:polysaccharide biosynthesis protein PelD
MNTSLAAIFGVRDKTELPAKAMMETILITLLLPAVGYLLHPQDPFFLDSRFPWLALAPLLLSLRYGFAYGFGSAASTVIAMAYIWQTHPAALGSFPTETVIAILLISAVAGEFRNTWRRHHEVLTTAHELDKTRFESFTRVYQVLKASHAKLEHQLAGRTVSLRTALFQLRTPLLHITDEDPIGSIANSLLRLFGDQARVQMGAIYRVEDNARIVLPAAGHFGSPPQLSASNPLLLEALQTGHTVSIRTEHRTADTSVLAVIPMVDITGNIWAVITVNEMPFVAFEHGNLDLMTVLAGYSADLLRSWATSGGRQPAAERDFQGRLQRSLIDVRRNHLPATLTAIVFASLRFREPLIDWVYTESRYLDFKWLLKSDAGYPVLLVLSPLTTEAGVGRLLQRLECFLSDEYGVSVTQAGLTIHVHQLISQDTPARVLDRMKTACQIGAKEVGNVTVHHLARWLGFRGREYLDSVEH